MKTNTTSPLALKDILLYVLAYLLWLVNVVVCVAAVIQFRATVNVLWVALEGDRYSLGLVNQLIDERYRQREPDCPLVGQVG